jgi:OOP family OmpA-OmpF porin
MTKLKQAALAAAVALAVGVPGVSMAQMRGESGWYAGAHFGQSDVDEAGEKDTAFRILGGYQINRTFAVELGYTDFGEVEEGGIRFEGNAIEVTGVASFPVADRFSIYGKLGLARTEAEARLGPLSADEDSIEVTYGIGVRYDFSQNMGVRGEWQRYPDVGDGASDVDVLSVGVVFNF